MFFKRTRQKKMRMPREEMAEDNPSNYEGKEHVRYENPGYAAHNIRFPEDEPHMKSRVRKNEEHEAEDNYHMGIPDQTDDTLPKRIPRARMKMDGPQGPKPLRGNLVTMNGKNGIQDEDGWEDYGPHDMQEDDGDGDNDRPRKETRKKMIVAVMKRKMKKRQDED